MSDEERAAADEQLKSQFRELAEDGAMMKDALRGIGGVSALQAADAAQTERLIDGIAASNEATAVAVLEGLRALEPPAADAAETAN